jgi:hypothetical protein
MARDAILRQVTPYDLHGVRWYQLVISFADSPSSATQVRLSHDNVYDSPEAGDEVQVETLLSMITEVRKAPIA